VKRASVAPRARAELRAAVLWYRAQDPKVARRFLDDVTGCIARLVETPRIWPLRDHGARRALIPRFPYYVYYREAGDGVQVIAIVHNRRHPDVWREGLRDDPAARE
jgi:plasmid stabilization system protein ParE